MIEPIGPAIARTIVGEDYSPDFRYELETNDEGMRIIAINKETGESSVRPLVSDEASMKRVDPLYDDERLDSLRSYKRQGVKGFLLALIVVAMLFASVCIAVLALQGRLVG